MTRALASGLAALYFFTNVAAGHAAVCGLQAPIRLNAASVRALRNAGMAEVTQTGVSGA